MLIEWPINLPTPLINRDHTFNSRNIITQMSSTRVRVRRQFDETVELINCQWNFTNDEFSEFKHFFDVHLENGANNFLLVTYDLSPTPHYVRVVTREVNFYGAKYSGGRDDNLHAVNAVLEVVDSDVYEVENWFDPVPPIPENPLPEVPLEMSACRDEFTLTFDGLDQDTIYGIEISDDEFGAFLPHIYFALQTDAEKSSRTKILTFNNDYNGEAWLRMVRIGGGYAILTRPTNPQASILPAPVITISNLSEITTQQMVDDFGTAAAGLIPLWSDADGDVFKIPMSLVEDKMIWLSDTYRRPSKKYVQKQGWADSNDRFGDLLAEKTPGVNLITVLNQPAGAIFTFTRDQSDPEIDTYMPNLQSLPLNVQAQDHRFGGVVKCRFFQGGCRSPLCTVLIDKLMHEIPTIECQVVSNGINGYCDYPQTDPLTGLPSESGNSCNLLWGGDCNFEGHIVGLGWSGGSPAITRWSPSIPHTSLRRHIKTLAFTTYLGWDIDLVGAQYWDFSSFNWFNRTFNSWHIAPKTHNWAITNTPASIMHPIDFDESVCGEDSEATDTAALFMGDCSFKVGAAMPTPPDAVCHTTTDLELTYSRFDIVRATQWWENPRDTFWFNSPDPFEPPVPTLEPGADEQPVLPFDDFETYLDGDASVMTLDFNVGIDWNGNWVYRAGQGAAMGYDMFDGYVDGAIPPHTTHFSGDGYDPYDGGELWEVGGEWISGLDTFVRGDAFTADSDGVVPFDMGMNDDATAWQANEGWRTGAVTDGFEEFTSYADGAMIVAATGTNFLASETWRAT